MNIKLLFLCILSAGILQGCCFNGSCPDDVIEEPFQTAYEPIILDRAEFESSIVFETTKEIENAGKIYVFEDFLFITEKREGFHIYDNSDPSNPIALSFLKVPGATDIAIRNGVYYINQAVDLIAITLAIRENSPTVSKRIRNVFPEIISPDGYFATGISENEVVIGWQLINPTP
ncbi:hypothetical protein ACFQO1_08040 [Jejudonia soesokkakensis]|uniref:LVIVD repeat-containing protein n=1 Tax=Jejudonia soesokkakensis TaxID=1323432 RepID=A0ABW2MW31_9FLAO